MHLEALKLGLEPFAPGRIRGARERITGWGLGLSGTIAVLCAIYFVAEAAKNLLGAAAPWVLGFLLAALYVGCLRIAAKCPDLPKDIDVKNPVLP